MNRTYQEQFAADAGIAQLRATTEAAGIPLGQLIDFIGEGMNAAGWVVEDPRLYADLPPAVFAQLQASGFLTIIRQASAEAFVVRHALVVHHLEHRPGRSGGPLLVPDQRSGGGRRPRRGAVAVHLEPALVAEAGD